MEFETASAKAQWMAKRALVAWVEDASHGWLCVNTSPIDGMPSALEFATHFSFVGEDQVFLEEDCDAPAFLKYHEIDLGASLLGTISLDEAGSEALRSMPRGEAELTL